MPWVSTTETDYRLSYAAISASNCKVQPISSSPLSRQYFSKSPISNVCTVPSGQMTDCSSRSTINWYPSVSCAAWLSAVITSADRAMGRDTVLVAVVTENISKRGGKNRLEPVLLKCPRCVLTRAATTEVHASDEDTRVLRSADRSA